eukprot:341769_1
MCLQCMLMDYRSNILHNNGKLNDFKIFFFQFPLITKRYKQLYKLFKKECIFWKYYFALNTIAFFFMTWRYASQMIHAPNDATIAFHSISGIFFYPMPLAMFVISSSNLSKQFKNLRNELIYFHDFENINVKVYNCQSLNEINKRFIGMTDYLFLCKYIENNQLIFSIFGKNVNIENGLKFAVIFIGA